MAIELIDGFDHYNSATFAARKWDSSSSITDQQTGRFAAFSARLATSNALTITLTAVATRVIGFAWQWNGTAPTGIIAQFLDAGTTQVELRTNSSQVLTVTRNGTLLGTASMAGIGVSTWVYIEFKATINSSGSYEIRVNGSSVLSGSGNTQNTANANANQVKFTAAANFAWFDDLYILNTSGAANNDFLGECRIFTSLPTGDDASFKQWTPSTGTSHFANVDDNPPNDDTDYNSSSTVGQIDLFTFPSISPTGNIVAVQTVLSARKDDAGTRQIVEECRSSGTNYDGGTTFTMNSTYGMFRQIREVDPATSAAWTSSAVNAAEFGVKCVA